MPRILCYFLIFNTEKKRHLPKRHLCCGIAHNFWTTCRALKKLPNSTKWLSQTRVTRINTETKIRLWWTGSQISPIIPEWRGTFRFTHFPKLSDYQLFNINLWGALRTVIVIAGWNMDDSIARWKLRSNNLSNSASKADSDEISVISRERFRIPTLKWIILCLLIHESVWNAASFAIFVLYKCKEADWSPNRATID